MTHSTKYHSLLFTLLLGLTAFLPCPTAFALDYAKLMEKRNYEKLEKEMLGEKNKMTREEDFVEYNYWRTILYLREDYTRFNPTKAYNIINNLQRRFLIMKDQKTRENLAKKNITNEALVQLSDTACRLGLKKALEENTIDGYDRYLQVFDFAREEWKETAKNKREELAFEKAVKLNTEEGYDEYIRDYPESPHVADAKAHMEDLAWEISKNENSIRSYEVFLSRFPDTKRARIVKDSIWAKAFRIALRDNTTASYDWFAETYPDSPQASTADSLKQRHAYADLIVPNSWSSYLTFLSLYNDNREYRNRALDSLLTLSKKDKVVKGLLYYLNQVPETPQRHAIISMIYNSATADGELSTINFLKDTFPEVRLYSSFAKDLAAAQFANEIDFRTLKLTEENKVKAEQYIRQCNGKDLGIVALQHLIREDVKAKRWDNAIAICKSFQKELKNNPKYAQLLEVLERKPNEGIHITNIGATNSPKGNQYYPVISADGKKLYFCGRDRDDNIGGEDVFVSKRTSNGWSKPVLLEQLSDPNCNDGILAVSADGTQVLKFENGIMGICEKDSNGWKPVQFFPPSINRGIWNSDATLCGDGRTLLFTSIRPSSMDINRSSIYHGNNHYESDLYVSQRDSSGRWSEPVNLGPTVNSIYSERSPFMHPDMRTLYFSSDGHGGLGGYDVYKSVRLSDTCWNCWSEPENLGREINTADDDWTYKISTDGSTAYFSQKETDSNKSNIYSINLPAEQKPFKVVTVSGKMVNRSGKKVSTKLMWEDLESHKIVGMAQSDPEDGSFFIVLPAGKMYGVFVSDTAIYPETRNVDLRKVTESASAEKTFHVTTIEELKSGKAVTINNIFFDFGKSDLLHYSFPELNRLAKLLKKMDLTVEISGHTDDVGSDEVNNKLSQQRADAVRNFLVKQGCNADKILAKGYGKTKPLADNKTERGRAKNRRVEMKVIQ